MPCNTYARIARRNPHPPSNLSAKDTVQRSLTGTGLPYRVLFIPGGRTARDYARPICASSASVRLKIASAFRSISSNASARSPNARTSAYFRAIAASY